MEAIQEIKLNDYICHQADLIDSTFFKEAVQRAMELGVSDLDFRWFIEEYTRGKMWIFVHQN